MDTNTILMIGVGGYLAQKSGLLGTTKKRRKTVRKTKRKVKRGVRRGSSVVAREVRKALRRVGATRPRRHTIVKHVRSGRSFPRAYDTVQYAAPAGPVFPAPRPQMFSPAASAYASQFGF